MDYNKIAIAAITGAVGVLIANAIEKWWKRKRGIVDTPINSIVCAKCGTKPPRFGNPRKWRHIIWGGWTCRNCGAAHDRYGRATKDEK